MPGKCKYVVTIVMTFIFNMFAPLKYVLMKTDSLGEAFLKRQESQRGGVQWL